MNDSLSEICSDTSNTSLAVNFILHSIYMTGSSKLVCGIQVCYQLGGAIEQ